VKKINHSELAKNLPPDFFPKEKITGAEFRLLLVDIKTSEEPAVKLLEFLRRHGFDVET